MLHYLIGSILLFITWTQVVSNPTLIDTYIEKNRVKPQQTLLSPDQTYNKIMALTYSYGSCTDPLLSMAIVYNESTYKNVKALAETSTGLMQIKPETARWIGCSAKSEQDLLNVEMNISCGCRYLGQLAHRYKKTIDVIAAYNAGSSRRCTTGTLSPSGKSCNIGLYVNQEYVNKVTRTYYGYRNGDIP